MTAAVWEGSKVAKGDNQKLKLMYLAKIFMEETDEDHALTTPGIIARLKECGVNADRKTLYLDLEELRRFGLDIIAERRGHATFYFLGAREFELPELKLLVDSVQAAKFITEKKSRELIRKLEGLINGQQARQLHRQVYIAGRVKTMNESIYYNIDRLHAAINSGLQIRFQYCRWNIDQELELRKKGAWYQASPWGLCWDDENYYLVAYDAGEDLIKHFRVDKMMRIAITEEPRLGQERFREFDMAHYAKSLFGMFGGEETEVVFEGENGMVGVLIDRFGKDISIAPRDENTFEARVTVAVSPQFFGWVMALGSGIRVTGPAPVVERLRREAERLIRQYGA